MCGIFAYYNFRVSRDRKAILELLFTGLKRLEYRGYDSAGIAFDACDAPVEIGVVGHAAGENGNVKAVYENGSASLVCTPIVIKSAGKIDALVKLAYEEVVKQGINLDEVLDNHAGIAHTRWATHGVPTPRNSHPQVSNAANEFVVVHNGIITNYKALKDFLVRGHAKPFLGLSPPQACISERLLAVLLLQMIAIYSFKHSNVAAAGQTRGRI